jgi:hypothetical protein
MYHGRDANKARSVGQHGATREGAIDGGVDATVRDGEQA